MDGWRPMAPNYVPIGMMNCGPTKEFTQGIIQTSANNLTPARYKKNYSTVGDIGDDATFPML